ncbi:hypothetical protein ACWJJH_02715 [Endozoicomonadaceae bacterium StTr2]
MKPQNLKILFRLGCVLTILILQPFSLSYASGEFLKKSFPFGTKIKVTNPEDDSEREVTLRPLSEIKADEETLDPTRSIKCSSTKLPTATEIAEAGSKKAEPIGLGFSGLLNEIYPKFDAQHSTYCFKDAIQGPFEIAPVMIVGLTVFAHELGPLVKTVGSPLTKISGPTTQLTLGLTSETRTITWHFPSLSGITLVVVLHKTIQRQITFQLVTPSATEKDTFDTTEFVLNWPALQTPVFYTKAMQMSDFILEKETAGKSSTEKIASQTSGTGKLAK